MTISMNGRDGDRPRPRRPFFENEGLISVKSNFANGIPKDTYTSYVLTYLRFRTKKIVNDIDIEGSWDVGRQNGPLGTPISNPSFYVLATWTTT